MDLYQFYTSSTTSIIQAGYWLSPITELPCVELYSANFSTYWSKLSSSFRYLLIRCCYCLYCCSEIEKDNNLPSYLNATLISKEKSDI